MTDQHRLLGHLAIHRRVPKSELEANFGADVVAGALETGLIHADFFGATDITERGMRQFNYAPLERQLVRVAEAEPMSPEEDSEAEEGIVPSKKQRLVNELRLMFESATKPLTVRECAEAIHTNTSDTGLALAILFQDGEIEREGVGGKADPYRYARAALFERIEAERQRDYTDEEIRVMNEEANHDLIESESGPGGLLAPDRQDPSDAFASLGTAMGTVTRAVADGMKRTSAAFQEAFGSDWQEVHGDPSEAVDFPAMDRELTGMNAALRALEPLDSAGRMRAVDWLIKRFDITDYYQEKR